MELLPVVGFPATGLQDFVLFDCDKTSPLVSQGQPSVTLVCSYILSCCLFFDCVAVMKKKKNECMKKGNDAIRAIPLHVREKTLHIINWLKGMRTS